MLLDLLIIGLAKGVLLSTLVLSSHYILISCVWFIWSRCIFIYWFGISKAVLVVLLFQGGIIVLFVFIIRLRGLRKRGILLLPIFTTLFYLSITLGILDESFSSPVSIYWYFLLLYIVLASLVALLGFITIILSPDKRIRSL